MAIATCVSLFLVQKAWQVFGDDPPSVFTHRAWWMWKLVCGYILCQLLAASIITHAALNLGAPQNIVEPLFESVVVTFLLAVGILVFVRVEQVRDESITDPFSSSSPRIAS
jgi:hypothetical protein